MTSPAFDSAFNKTMEIEGRGQLSNDNLDPGGQTFSGISRVYWPEWAGWPIIDRWLNDRSLPFPAAILDQMTREFYRVNFWQRMQGDKLAAISTGLAEEVFDTAVNLDVYRAVCFLQAGHNIAAGYRNELLVDGLLGPRTLETIKNYLDSQPGSRKLNEEILLNCMNGEQYCHYKANPKHKYFRGWFRRV